MHTSFTGSTKKARQVNLQGRANFNPWAKSAGPANTIAHAQAEREKRALDRRRLTAAKNIQRVWRGHRSRRRKQAEWREQWNVFEQQRIAVSGSDQSISRQEPIQQMRLLLRFYDVKSADDHRRLLSTVEKLEAWPKGKDTQRPPENLLDKFGIALAGALRVCDEVATDDAIPALRSNGGLPAEQYLDDKDWQLFCSRILERYLRALCNLILWRAPDRFVSELFAALERLKQWALRLIPASTQLLFANTTISALRSLGRTPTAQVEAYASFTRLLTVKEFYLLPETLRNIADSTDLTLLADAIVGKLDAPGGPHESQYLTPPERTLTVLSFFVYCRANAALDGSSGVPLTQAKQNTSSAVIITTMTRLLELSGPVPQDWTDVPEKIGTLLKSLKETSSIDRFLADIAALPVDPAEGAKIMAKYALSLLRAFPAQAYDIRMRIFLNPNTNTSSSGTSLTSLRYFWQAALNTDIFKVISQSQRNVLALLKHTNGIQPGSRSGLSSSTLEYATGPNSSNQRGSRSWKDDWRLILFFLEMYTSALKLMDDEEFFSLSGGRNAIKSEAEVHKGRGALPLSEVTQMVAFLKNLTYPLYWNATELSQDQPDLAGLEGVTQPYLKGLTTGVLRMLHERDSRRKFLPDNGWLMTNQVDMTSFIPEVVHEEEKRLTMGDVAEEEDSDDDFDGPTVNDTSDWSSRANFRVGGYGRLGSRQPDIVNRFVRKQERARRRNQVAAVAPRLELLRNLPFFIPFETRVNIFRQFVHNDQYRRRNGAVDPHVWRMTVEHTELGRSPLGARELLSKHTAKIRRDSVFQDAFDQFYSLGESLKEPIYIKFFDNQGIEERGIDGGGVTKEFLTSVTTQAFTPSPPGLSWFVENDQHYLHPNSDLYEVVVERNHRMGFPPSSEASREAIRNLRQQYEFLGRVVGKCLYEGILIDIRFAGFFLLKWALTGGTTSATNETAYRPTINDMRDMDPDVYHHLLALKNWEGNVEEDFGLNFTITDNMVLDLEGKTFSKTRELIQNGASVPVTNANRLLYIDRFVRYRLQHHPKIVTDAFLKGLGQMIEPMWLAMFNQKELQWLIGGDDSELDLVDLRRNTDLGGIYQRGDDPQDHPTIELFWNVLKEMDDKDRREILRFATSTPRAPLLGFSNLHPKFSIRDSTNDEGRHDLNRLPTSSTCVNQLKLPPYKSKAQMREKLLYAAKSGAGFDLS